MPSLFSELEVDSHWTCDLFIKQANRATYENETPTTNGTAASHTLLLFVFRINGATLVASLKKDFLDSFLFGLLPQILSLYSGLKDRRLYPDAHYPFWFMN